MEETNAVNEGVEKKKKSEYRRNFYVFLALAALTILEFGVAIGLGDRGTVALLIIALVKAGLIVQFFMHISRVWSKEEHG